MAIKIKVSSITSTNNEVNILRELRTAKQDHAGSYHIIRLLDDFTIQGPNGIHECLVTEVVTPAIKIRGAFDFRPTAKKISFQTLLGLSYLHEKGVAHGGMYSSPLVPEGHRSSDQQQRSK